MKLLRMKFQERVRLIDNNTRLHLIFTIAIIGALASLIMTVDAWSSLRNYALSPIIPFTTSAATQHILYATLVCGLAASLCTKKYRRHLVSAALIALLLLVAQDITRLQPWIIHYTAILLLFSFAIPKKYAQGVYMLDAARLVVGGMYFWAGVQKFNIRFFTEVFPWFTESLWRPFGETGATIAIIIGLCIPVIEAGFALGFFTRRFRHLSLLGATSMIIVVLTCLGPLGHSWNSSVWPWNFGIYGMAVALFLGLQTSLPEFIKRQRHNALAWIAFAFFWIMPIGNYFGVTDHYLSWSLYSGHVPEATLIGNQATLFTLSEKAAAGHLKFAHWSQTELNMVPYPEIRVFEDVFQGLCADKQYQNIHMEIMVPRLFASQKHETLQYRCDAVGR